MMKKLMWGCALAVLCAGAYWSVAHANMNPESPVGRCLSWLGFKPGVDALRPAAPVFVACAKPWEPMRSGDPQPLIVRAEKPTTILTIQSDFPLMTDPDGNAVAVPVVPGANAQPIREYDVTSEEIRIMPEVLAEEPIPFDFPKKKVEIAIGLNTSGVTCSMTVAGCCKMLTLPGLFEYVCSKVCSPVTEVKKVAVPPACCKQCPGHCPASGAVACPVVKPESIAEPPVEVEESEPKKPLKPTGLLPRRGTGVDTMEVRPSDSAAVKGTGLPY